MSKVGFWLRGSKGKLGDSYLSKGPDGATVQHVIGEVKNPRSIAQMQQRMVMATAMAAYAGMKEIVDHSFEGVTYSQATMSTFISYNAKMLRESLLSGNSNIAFNPYQDRSLYPNPYIVSKGSVNHNLIINVDGSLGSVIPFSLGFVEVDLETITVAEWLKHIGVSLNSYLTILCVAYSPETKIHQFGWIRLTPSGQDLDLLMSTVKLDEVFDIESNVPTGDFAVTFDPDHFNVDFDFDQGGIKYCSYAVILSEKQLSWKRSTEKMNVYVESPYTPPTPAESLATYPVGTDYVLNGGNV